MAGITKSPQLRLSPDTANVQVDSPLCARQIVAPATAINPTHKPIQEDTRILNMKSAYRPPRRYLMNSSLRFQCRISSPPATYKINLAARSSQLLSGDLVR